MRKLKGTLLIFVVILSLSSLMFFTNQTQLVEAEVDPLHIDSTWTEDTTQGCGIPLQHQTFYDPTHEYYYLFYCYTYGSGYDGSMVYKSSPDGENWGARQIVRTGNITSGGCYYAKAFSIDFNGTHVAYAYADDKQGDNIYDGETGVQYGLHYRLGHTNSSGLITWDAPDQYFCDTLPWYYASCIFDSDGYNWFTTMQVHPSNESGPAYVFRNSARDGTWSNASGFPYIIEDESWQSIPAIRQTDDDNIFVTWSYNGTDTANTNIQEKCRRYNGTWSDEMEIPKNNYYFYPPYEKDLTTIGNDVYFICMATNPNKTLYNIRMNIYNATTGVWGDSSSVEWGWDGLDQLYVSGLVKAEELNSIFAFFPHNNGTGANQVSYFYYRRYSLILREWEEAVYLSQYSNSSGFCPINAETDSRSRGGIFSVVYCTGYGITGGNYHDYEYPIYWIEFSPEVGNIAVDILNMEGCGNWVFQGEGYYDFYAQYQSDYGIEYIDTLRIAFSDGLNWINASYDKPANVWALDSGSDVVNLKDGDIAYNTYDYDVTFYLYFTNKILDALDVDIYMWSNTTTGETSGWQLIEEDYFNIYNLGGFGSLETSGTAGRIDGGGVFALYAENSSSAMANVTFRKLQQYHALFHVWVPDQRLWDDWESDTITIEMGFSYCYDDVWYDGWNVYIEQAEGWLDASGQRLQWTVKWYYNGVEQWSDVMNSFPLCNATGDNIPAQTSFIIDLWFNKINASSTVGGRLTSEYFAMRDNANAWLKWATGSDWGADVGNVTQAMYFDNLVDGDGNIISSKEIEMMRIWVKLEQGANAHDIRVELRDFDLENFVKAPGTMEGINTPIFIATKTPNMPQTGFLNALFGMLNEGFNQIVVALGPALLEFWTAFLGFLDTIFAALGYPGLASTLSDAIYQFSIFFADSVQLIVDLLVPTFEFLNDTIGFILTQFTNFITFFITLATIVKAILDGTSDFSTGVGNLWSYIEIEGWADFIPIVLLISWMASIDARARAGKSRGVGWISIFMGDLTSIMNVFSFIITATSTIINLFVSILFKIIDAIPVV